MINFISPLTVAFAVILLGYAIGKIRFFNISLDLSAILLVAIIFGFVIAKCIPNVIDGDFNSAMNSYSNLGTAIFVSVIGITTGLTLKLSSKKTVLYFIIGSVAVLIGFEVTSLIGYMDIEIDRSVLLGILSGALTSTPALSAISERPDVISENAVIGYGVAYILGVVIVVISTQITGRNILKKSITKNEQKAVTVSDGTWGLILIAICALIGEMLGNLSLFGYSLGTTGSVLICGIIIGCIIRKSLITSCAENVFPIYRNLGLILFFVGNGITAGARLNSNISIKWFLCGILITLVSVMSVFIICKILIRNKSITPSLIAGSMTSTPALGVLVKKGYSVDLTAYSISYVGALLTMTVGIKFV